jgi:hypothetical protein
MQGMHPTQGRQFGQQAMAGHTWHSDQDVNDRSSVRYEMCVLPLYLAVFSPLLSGALYLVRTYLYLLYSAASCRAFLASSLRPRAVTPGHVVGAVAGLGC